MPIRIPVESIIVQREGKNLRPKIGQPFDFTKEEIDHIKKVNPRAFRLPIDESNPVAKNAEEALAIAKAQAQRDPVLGEDGEPILNGGGVPAQGPTASELLTQTEAGQDAQPKEDAQPEQRKVDAGNARGQGGRQPKAAGKADDDAL